MDPGGALNENICNKNASISWRFTEKGFSTFINQDLLNGEKTSVKNFIQVYEHMFKQKPPLQYRGLILFNVMFVLGY